MPATDALTVRTQVTEQLSNALYQTYFNSRVADTLNEVHSNEPITARDMTQMFGLPTFVRTMMLAENFYVHPDMQTVVQAAAESFPDDEVIIKEDLPSECGFLYFPLGVKYIELRGRINIVKAILWCNDRVWLLGDLRDIRDEVMAGTSTNLDKHGIRYDVVAMTKFSFGRPLPLELVCDKGILPTDAKVEFTRTKEGGLAMSTDQYLDPSNVHQTPSPILRLLLATWRIMQQTITSLDVMDKHPKPAMRYALRAKVPPKVTVIKLRRYEGHEGTGTGTPLTYRLIVRGHWRKVWCGPKNDPAKRYQRSVFIHSHLRGPDGAPLHISEKVNSLVR